MTVTRHETDLVLQVTPGPLWWAAVLMVMLGAIVCKYSVVGY